MGKRYACFTEEQQKAFDGLNTKHQKYILCRGQGYGMAEAYRLSGYKGHAHAQSGYDLEKKRYPFFEELIKALKGQFEKVEIFNNESILAKEIDKKAKEKSIVDQIASTYVPKVVENAPVSKPLDLSKEIEKLSIDQVQNLQFWRDVATGKIVTEKEIKTYDKDGNLTGKKVEKIKDVSIRMKAQEVVARMLNMEEIMQLGTVEVPNVNIMIVDARKKEPSIIEGKTEIESE